MVTGLQNSRLSPDCETCKDTGFVSRIAEDDDGDVRTEARDCPACPRTEEGDGL